MTPRLLFCLVLVFTASAGAEERSLLARFELLAVAGEYPVGYVAPKKIVSLYHVILHREANSSLVVDVVDVERTEGERTTVSRLTSVAGQRLLEAFEEARLPDVDYPRVIAELRPETLQPHRGVILGGAMGGARKVDVTLNVGTRPIHLQGYNLESLLYGHLNEPPVRALSQLIEACAAALGAEQISF